MTADPHASMTATVAEALPLAAAVTSVIPPVVSDAGARWPAEAADAAAPGADPARARGEPVGGPDPDPAPPMAPGKLRPLLLLALLGGGLVVLALPPVRGLFTPAGVDALREAAATASPLELLGGTLVAAGLVALGAPRLVLAGLAGAALGGWLGGALATAAGVLGSLICFAGARSLGRDWARSRLGGTVPGLDAACRQRGLLVTVLLRTSPIGFGHVTNLALAVSCLGFDEFLLGTALGVAPSTFVVASMGSTAAAGSWPLLASCAVLLVGLVILLRRVDPLGRLAPELADAEVEADPAADDRPADDEERRHGS